MIFNIDFFVFAILNLLVYQPDWSLNHLKILSILTLISSYINVKIYCQAVDLNVMLDRAGQTTKRMENRDKCAVS